MKTYSLPKDEAFRILRAEARHYLDPLGFEERETKDSSFHLSVHAGSGEAADYTLENSSINGKTTLGVSSESLVGATDGFYHALRLLGFEFSFFADAIPPEVHLRWPSVETRLDVQPAFATRGLLAWHNFLNSPTTWNLSDYEHYLQTLRRLGGNTVIFRQRDHGRGEPLAALRDDQGRWILGERMATSLNCPWGLAHGIKTDSFAHETGQYFTDQCNGEWGAAHCFTSDPIAAAQEEFAAVCHLSRSIGIDVAFGYELGGDPSAPGAKSQAKRRIAHLLATYPDIATLCIWHYECWGLLGWNAASVSPGYPKMEERYGKFFRYLKGNPARVAEGCRLAEWFTFIYEASKELRPSLKIVFSGWGGDRWMRWGDYWKGLHELLPSDVILSQLDNIDPYVQDGVSQASKEIGQQRELWSIPWLESDAGVLGRASQWHPQEDTALMLNLARSAKALDYSGLLGIHWQTAAVEQNVSCLLGAGWNRWQSAAEFRSHYATRFFSNRASVASEVARLLEELENLGPGWTGTGQQVECDKFSWDPAPALTTETPSPEIRAFAEAFYPVRDKLADTPSASNIWRGFDTLRFMCDQMRGNSGAISRLAALRKSFQALDLNTPHARRLLATVDFVLSYEEIRSALMSGGWLSLMRELIEESRALHLQPDPRLSAQYEAGLRKVEALWQSVFAAQVSRLQTRGDLGNLATINLKAYEAWRRFKGSDAAGLQAPRE